LGIVFRVSHLLGHTTSHLPFFLFVFNFFIRIYSLYILITIVYPVTMRFIVTIPNRLISYFGQIILTVSLCQPFPTTLKTIAKGFFVLFHISI
jgi:hypothetical protein